MVYLETVGVVHRDLRAANVLIDADGSVRVADFGLTKIYGVDQNHTSGAFPFRWTAPEAMQASPEVDTKADVWSFGVLMFEVLTYGRTPYEDCKSYSEVKNFLSSGGRLPSPRSIGFQCENAVYVIMQSCWMMQPAMRPSFRMLSTRIEESIIDREGRYSPPFNKAWEN